MPVVVVVVDNIVVAVVVAGTTTLNLTGSSQPAPSSVASVSMSSQPFLPPAAAKPQQLNGGSTVLQPQSAVSFQPRPIISFQPPTSVPRPAFGQPTQPSFAGGQAFSLTKQKDSVDLLPKQPSPSFASLVTASKAFPPPAPANSSVLSPSTAAVSLPSGQSAAHHSFLLSQSFNFGAPVGQSTPAAGKPASSQLRFDSAQQVSTTSKTVPAAPQPAGLPAASLITTGDLVSVQKHVFLIKKFK